MLGTLSSLALIPLIVCVGVCVPGLGIHFELLHRRETRHREELARRDEVIRDHETTIQAYRSVMAREMEGLAHTSRRANS